MRSFVRSSISCFSQIEMFKRIKVKLKLHIFALQSKTLRLLLFSVSFSQPYTTTDLLVTTLVQLFFICFFCSFLLPSFPFSIRTGPCWTSAQLGEHISTLPVALQPTRRATFTTWAHHHSVCRCPFNYFSRIDFFLLLLCLLRRRRR